MIYNHNVAADDTYDCDDNYDKKQQAVYNDDAPAGKYNNDNARNDHAGDHVGKTQGSPGRGAVKECFQCNPLC